MLCHMCRAAESAEEAHSAAWTSIVYAWKKWGFHGRYGTSDPMILRKPCGKKAAAHTMVPPAIMDRERGTRTGVWRLWRLALVLLAGSLPQMVEGYRIHDPNGTEPAPFEPYETVCDTHVSIVLVDGGSSVTSGHEADQCCLHHVCRALCGAMGTHLYFSVSVSMRVPRPRRISPAFSRGSRRDVSAM